MNIAVEKKNPELDYVCRCDETFCIECLWNNLNHHRVFGKTSDKPFWTLNIII